MGPDDSRTARDGAGASEPAESSPDLSESPTIPGIPPSPSRPGAAARAGLTFGPYFIHRLLGRGGMGEVYEAEHLETGRRVALKVLVGTAASALDRARFLREGRLAASVNHPNTVYVFGAEEIGGTPAISMELVVGGTLQDRVAQKGAMKPAQAVDAILQVIDGLEAASAQGVLHRDVKPSNCFVEPEGTVKVGDFGLSMIAAGREATQLTVAGSFLGTPGFASPEQLRGETLDARTDIYSVGATLYFLLTGRPPFGGTGLVRLLAAVLEQEPASPRRLRSEVPRRLAEVVLRCLQKNRSRRFASYADLREALVPLGSTAPTPATLGLRLLAGMIDSVVIWTAGLVYAVVGLGVGRRSVSLAAWVLHSLPLYPVLLLYYALPEARWGASLGKALLRLRVVGPDRGVPGLGRALLRAGLVNTVPGAPWWLVALLRPDADMVSLARIAPGAYWFGMTGSMVLLWGLFLTMRRTNGYAALHDLVSDTRVVERTSLVRPGRPAAIAAPEPGVPAGGARIGPYVAPDGGGAPGSVVNGYDERLRRRVWIRMLPPGTEPIPPARRSLGRPGRLRWLNGRRTPTECWDAWEAPAGCALPDLIAPPRPWSEVRRWLVDLAEELEASERDGTQPDLLSLERVWITDQGRAKLLDFPASRARQAGAGAPREAGFAARGLSPHALLLPVASAALEGRVRDPDSPWVPPPPPFPLQARALLSDLARGRLAGPGRSAAALRAAQQRLAEVSRARRLAHLALCSSLPIAMWMASVVMLTVMARMSAVYPEIDPLNHAIERLEQLREACPTPAGSTAEDCARRAAMETYMAGRFRPLLEDHETWNHYYASFLINPRRRALTEDVILGRPAPSEEETRRAAEEIHPLLAELASDGLRVSSSMVVRILATLLFVAAVPGTLSALIFGGGGALRLLGLAVAGPDGSPASRLRCLVRALVAWSPALIPAIVRGMTSMAGTTPRWLQLSLDALAPGFLLVGGIVAVARPCRGLQDRLAGTWLVPR